MKYKIAFIILALSIICSPSNAQLVRSFGVKVGVVQASQAWDYSGMLSGVKIYDKSRIGLDVGGYIEWFDLPIFSIVTEAHYIQKGSKDEFEVTTIDFPDGTGEMMTRSPRIDYLSVPLLVKLRYETADLSLYGIGGPRLDFVIGKNIYASGVVFNEFKSPEYGFTVGVGIELSIMSYYKIGGEIRRSYSSQYAYSNQNLSVKNNSTEFLLTIGF